MAAGPVEELCRALCDVFDEEKRLGEKISYAEQSAESVQRLDTGIRASIQRALAAGGADAFKPYVHFCDDHYTRNLVHCADGDFELMVLCWKKGQGSRVHNHANSHGWVTVLKGRVEETRYLNPGLSGGAGATSDNDTHHVVPVEPPPLPGVLAAISPCPELTVTQTSVADPGTTLYINDGLALHAVRCADDTDWEDQGAVTLHLYAPPVHTPIFLYEPENNRIIKRLPGFFSKGGVRVE